MQQVIERGYFMSQEEQDAVIGRVVREHKAATTKLAYLRSEATRLGQELSAIGQALMSQPDSLIRRGEDMPGRFAGPQLHIVNPEALDLEKIMRLTKEIRERMKEIGDLDKDKSDLGI